MLQLWSCVTLCVAVVILCDSVCYSCDPLWLCVLQLWSCVTLCVTVVKRVSTASGVLVPELVIQPMGEEQILVTVFCVSLLIIGLSGALYFCCKWWGSRLRLMLMLVTTLLVLSIPGSLGCCNEFWDFFYWPLPRTCSFCPSLIPGLLSHF